MKRKVGHPFVYSPDRIFVDPKLWKEFCKMMSTPDPNGMQRAIEKLKKKVKK